MEETSKMDEFIHDCINEFLDSKYDYDYKEHGKLKAMFRQSGDCHVCIMLNDFAMSAYATTKKETYFNFMYLRNAHEIVMSSGEYKKFEDGMMNIFTLDCLGAL